MDMKSTLNMAILVFSTSIRDKDDVELISETLDNLAGIHDWSVDLDDWEKVLRIEGINLNSSVIRKQLLQKGVLIREMATE